MLAAQTPGMGTIDGIERTELQLTARIDYNEFPYQFKRAGLMRSGTRRPGVDIELHIIPLHSSILVIKSDLINSTFMLKRGLSAESCSSFSYDIFSVHHTQFLCIMQSQHEVYVDTTLKRSSIGGPSLTPYFKRIDHFDAKG